VDEAEQEKCRQMILLKRWMKLIRRQF